MLKTIRPVLAATAILASVGLLSACTPEPDPVPAPTVDTAAISSDYEVDEDGFIVPGSGILVGTTVPTYFADSTGTWGVELTVQSIEQGSADDLSVITNSNADLDGLVPYYTTITATVVDPDDTANGKSLGTLFSYLTEDGVAAPRLVSINGTFPACTGDDAFPAAADGAEQKITFCQVSLSTPADPVVQVNWQPTDTAYAADGGEPVFFRLAENTASR